MNKSETIILFQRLILEIEKLEKKQAELSVQLKNTGNTIIENQKIIWGKLKEMK